jgi:hypothetical protein
MFQIGQLVFVKSVSERMYLGMIMETILYLNNFEEAFYHVYLIGTADRVTVPSQFIVPVNEDPDSEIKLALFGTGSLEFMDLT